MAQSVKRPTLAFTQVMILRFASSSPSLGSTQCRARLGFSVSHSLRAPPLSLPLSLSKINKLLKKAFNKKRRAYSEL